MTARPNTPAVAWEKIGPTEASKILEEHNTHNLPLRNRLTVQYAADMAEGNWSRNGETVKIAGDGTLIDGQHRLAAVVLSDTTQEFLVVRGLPMEAQKTVDSGRKRALGTVLALDGVRYASVVGSLGRRILSWEGGARRDVARPNAEPTPSQVMAFLAQRPDIEQIHAPRAMAVRTGVSIAPANVGLASWIFTAIDDTDAADFFERLTTGANMDKEHPIMRLRHIAMELSRTRRRQPDYIWMALLIKAWNAYRSGDPMGNLRFISGGASPERFPEPR